LVTNWSIETLEALRALSPILSLLTDSHDDVDWNLCLDSLVEALLELLCHLDVLTDRVDFLLNTRGLHARARGALSEEDVLANLFEHSSSLDVQLWVMF